MRTSKCPYCGEVYRVHSGGHCMGGRFDGCCRTFASDSAGDAHRPVGGPCIDVTVAEGWRRNRWGEWTNTRPMSREAITARQAGTP